MYRLMALNRLIVCLTLLPLLLAVAPAFAAGRDTPSSDWSYVQKRLRQAQLPQNFINDMHKMYKSSDFVKILELNILLYLRQTDYHRPQVTGDAIGEVRAFVAKNKATFDAVEKQYGIQPEVISSLLYIETRHGANKGGFHVASVFLTLLQAERPAVIRYLKGRLPNYTDHYDKSVQASITSRSKKKAEWALGEIKALKDIHKRDGKILQALKGSFSGAFGMPQFLPSSYLALAKPFKSGRNANITSPDDAIASVAHYLEANGWRKNQERSFKRALMRYNNSEDYADAILNMAKKASQDREAQPFTTLRPRSRGKHSRWPAGR